jgi:hypothetical protein
MLRKADNVFSVALSDVSIATTTLPTAGSVVTNDNIPAGAIVMVDAGMRRTTLATLATGDIYHIVQGKGAGVPLMKTPAIKKGSETISSKAFAPKTQQITAIGFNGTTGALPVANETSFYIKIRKNDNDAANRSQPFSLFAQFKTDATATQEELAFGLVANGIANMRLEPANGYLRFETLINNAGAAITGTVANFGVTYGSKTVTLDGTVTNVNVGDVITLDGIAYKVEAVTSPTSITLEIAYQGTTGSIAVADVKVVAAATAATADFGVRLRGVEADFDVVRFRDFYVNRFTATFSDDATLVTHLQGASEGVGAWQHVAMDEYMNYGYEGQNDVIGVPPLTRDQVVKIPGVAGNTALTVKYSVINLKWVEDVRGALVSLSPAEGNVVIYLNLEDNAGSGILNTTPDNTGETLAAALGLTPADLNE